MSEINKPIAAVWYKEMAAANPQKKARMQLLESATFEARDTMFDKLMERRRQNNGWISPSDNELLNLLQAMSWITDKPYTAQTQDLITFDSKEEALEFLKGKKKNAT